MTKKTPRPLYEIIAKLKPEEIELLCERLGVDYYDLGGSSRTIKALNLQKYLSNRSRLHELLAELHREFPQEDLSPYLYYVVVEQFSSEANLIALIEGFGIVVRDFGGRETHAWGSVPWREQKGWALQGYVEENGRVPELLAALKKANPDVDLSFYTTSAPPPVPVPPPPAPGTFANFDIRLAAANDKYTPDVITSPRGQKKGTERALNLADVETMLMFLRSKGKARREDVEKLGQLLRETLLPEQIMAHLEHSLTEAENAGHQGLRVRLRFGLDQPDLLKLPWEYCHDSRGFLTLNNKTPFVRYLETNQPDYKPITVPRPVRVLVAIASPTDYPKLKVDEEAAWIKSALQELEQQGIVSLKIIENTTSIDLYKQIDQEFKPHIFHFIGHGDFDEAEKGALALEDGKPEPKARLFNTADMLELLRNSSVKLVILSACLTAAFENDDALMGIAPRLVDGGLPAVIAMQFPVPDDAAIAFSQFLYASLAVGEPLDVAITKARKGVYFSGTDKVFWGIPVVFMRTPDGVIWQPQV
jgi:hypothetical protein